MGIDLDFWKYKKNVHLDNQKVYEKACCDGEHVDALEALPIEKILIKIVDSFLDWKHLDEKTFEKDSKGSFQIFTTSQIVRFDCYGMDEDDLNLLIDIMLEFDCPLYDPQISQRFD